MDQLSSPDSVVAARDLIRGRAVRTDKSVPAMSLSKELEELRKLAEEQGMEDDGLEGPSTKKKVKVASTKKLCTWHSNRLVPERWS